MDWYYDLLIQYALTCAEESDSSKEIVFCAFPVAQGSTMLSTTTKYGVIKNFLAVVTSIALNHKQLGPFLNENDQDAECIKNFLSEVKR